MKLYITLVMICESKTRKNKIPIPHFWTISVRRASLLPLKYLLVKENNFPVHGKCPNFSMRLRWENYNAANFRLKSRVIRKPIFLTNKKLLVGTIYFRFIYLKAIYEQKMKQMDFSTLATKSRFWSIFPDRSSQNLLGKQ